MPDQRAGPARTSGRLPALAARWSGAGSCNLRRRSERFPTSVGGLLAEDDGQNNDATGNHRLFADVQPHDDQPVVDRADQQRSGKGAKDRVAPAEQAGATQDDAAIAINSAPSPKLKRAVCVMPEYNSPDRAAAAPDSRNAATLMRWAPVSTRSSTGR